MMGTVTAPGRRSTGRPIHSLRSRVARVTCALMGAVFHDPIRPGVVPGQNNMESEMSNTNETNRPTHTIFQVLGDGDKATWLRVGAAWMHADNQGARLVFNSFPLTGRIVMRARTDEAAANGGQQ